MTRDLSRHATWREIQAQPAIWRDWGAALDGAGLRDWVARLGVDEVWFCGAGSSAFLGDILGATLGPATVRFRAVPTTDLVSRPQTYMTGAPRLVVNFGRSGNSAETIGTLDALDALVPDWPRLNITCNAGSVLATRAGKVVLLPEATHDAGFAMTSSFTTMLLTALAIFDGSVAVADLPQRFAELAGLTETMLPVFQSQAQSARRPDRAVFVGAGPFAFAAREAALKVMELSAGQIPALWDSTLGFRHGPKSFVRGATDVWVFLNGEPQAARYDADLVAELRVQFPLSRITSVGAGGDVDLSGAAWDVVMPVVLAQVLAVVWSEALGLPVDDPFAGQGTLSRVVSGVTLYPVAP
jgi:tagatose-6-phosphate ketose/aldose isomerase